MRKNAKRVERLKENLIKELKYWFNSRPSVLQIELKNSFVTSLDIASVVGDYDLGTEEFNVVSVRNDARLLNDEGEAILINELTIHELAYLLDELEANKFTITIGIE